MLSTFWNSFSQSNVYPMSPYDLHFPVNWDGFSLHFPFIFPSFSPPFPCFVPWIIWILWIGGCQWSWRRTSASGATRRRSSSAPPVASATAASSWRIRSRPGRLGWDVAGVACGDGQRLSHWWNLWWMTGDFQDSALISMVWREVYDGYWMLLVNL